MAARTAIELLKMLATRSGVKNVFRQNLDDTFGKDEVKEGIRIITQREQNPELAKMFYKKVTTFFLVTLKSKLTNFVFCGLI